MALSNWTLAQVLDQLDSGEHWSGTTITYSFPLSASGLFGSGEAAGFRRVTESQQQVLTVALAAWDDLMQPNMVPGSGATDIEFGYTSTDIGYAHAYFPDWGSVWFNVNEPDLVNAMVGGYGFDTFVHEIGHALGLDHMGNYNGAGTWTPSSYQDSSVLSVMSYFGPRDSSALYSPDVMQADWTDANGQTWTPQTPMLNDIMAVQAMYGASTTTRTGNTVYGFNSNVAGAMSAILDFSRNAHPVLSIFDSGGQDTLDFSGWNTPSVMDLRGGGFSSANHMTNNVSIAYDTVIEDAVGGGGNDQITGNAASNQLIGGAGNDDLRGLGGDDTLIGGAGNDTIDGGDGSADTAVFDGTASAYTITVAGSTVTLVGPSGTDRVTNVERFRFSDVTRLLTELMPDADVTAPLLQSTTPADGAAGIAVGADLGLVFNEPVRAGSGTIDIYQTGGTLWRSIAVGDTQQVRFNGSVVTIAPSANLPAASSFYVTVPAGAVSDLSGNPFAGLTSPTSWNFSTSTADTTAPQIVRTTPADEDTQVLQAAVLVVEFDENVVIGSGNIVLQRNGQTAMTIAVTDKTQVSVEGNRVTIDPTALFDAGAVYSVTLEAGTFKDAAGNAFAGLTTAGAWNFSTTAPIAGDDYPMSPDTTGVLSTTGSILRARIDAATDSDLFKVEFVAGTTYRIDMAAATATLDPYLVLYGPQPDLQLLDFDDDSGIGTDAQLYYTPSQGGTYYVGATDFGGATGAYRLSVSKPYDDYSAATNTAGVLPTNGSAIYGTITSPTDSDMFAVTLAAGAHYTFDLARVPGGLADPFLMLFDAAGQPLAMDDESGGDGNARLGFAPAVSGTFYASAADFSTGLGRYKLFVTTRTLASGTEGADTLEGGAAAEAFSALGGTDLVRGGGGDDMIDGGTGIDTAQFSGARAAFTLQQVGLQWRVTDGSGAEGSDLLQGIERLRFADQNLALDLGGHAGQVAQLLGAVFGAPSVQVPEYVGIGLGLLDGGMQPEALAQLALDVVLGSGASDAAVVELLYRNLTGTTPPESVLTQYTGLLADGTYTPATLALLAGGLDLNLENIHLTELVANGLGYA